MHKKIEFNETKQKVAEIKFKESMEKLYHMQETLEEKYDIVEQERSSFLMRVETLSMEIKRYKDDLISMKEGIYDLIETTHLQMQSAIGGFNNQIEKVS